MLSVILKTPRVANVASFNGMARAIGNLPSLAGITIKNSSGRIDCSIFRDLATRKQLDISGNALSHVDTLGDLTAMETLILSGCVAIVDVSAFGKLPNLQTLDLAWCRHVTDVSALGGIHTINLSGCTAVTAVIDHSGHPVKK